MKYFKLTAPDLDLKKIKREAIMLALTRVQGRRNQKAAKLLGISERTLYSIMKDQDLLNMSLDEMKEALAEE